MIPFLAAICIISLFFAVAAFIDEMMGPSEEEFKDGLKKSLMRTHRRRL